MSEIANILEDKNKIQINFGFGKWAENNSKI